MFFPLLSSSKRSASSFQFARRVYSSECWPVWPSMSTRSPVFARVHGRRRKVLRDIAAAIRPSFRELNFSRVPQQPSRPPSLPLYAISPCASVFRTIHIFAWPSPTIDDDDITALSSSFGTGAVLFHTVCYALKFWSNELLGTERGLHRF